MSLFDGYYGGGNTNFSMPVAPAYGSYGNGNDNTGSDYEKQKLQEYINKMRSGI